MRSREENLKIIIRELRKHLPSGTPITQERIQGFIAGIKVIGDCKSIDNRRIH